MRYARRCKLRPEAMQIEAQALVPERVNQDPSGTRLPATAWPRQTFAAYTARPLRGHGGEDEGRLLALMQGPSRNAMEKEAVQNEAWG